MTIEYDEEVKLHDGSMIWVHITRHYFLAGEIAHGSAYMPSNVEISWDTGFKGVGRKSVYFDNLSVIDKYNNNWYLFGGVSGKTSSNIVNSQNASVIGSKVGQSSYLVVMNREGDYLKLPKKSLANIKQTNILNPTHIKDWGLVPESLNNQKLSWNEKLKLQNFQPKNRRFIHDGFDVNKVH